MFWTPARAILAITLGIGLLIGLEIHEEPQMTLPQILYELIEPALLVLTVAAVVHLMGRMRRQHQEQIALLRDLEVARSEGAQWRADMRELLQGLGKAIDAQFARWDLSEAEREVALLMLKGLSHKEIASIRSTSERTVREQARAIYAKANLSGRAALAAFFLEDLLLPLGPRVDR
ncbi:MAG: response regulator transcription factor [Ectothiorhodospiraceae bacterium]|nr:response regulator transcription factor [Ectothiorhodospiraceae bacterium]